METASHSTAGFKPHLLYKCLLFQYAQRSNRQPPLYETYNEGLHHQPKFRSTVWYSGKNYISPNTFPHRKEAEMDVARIAYLALMQKIKDEGSNLVREDPVFCKSILSEYAVRMNLEKPNYQTIQPDGTLPVFVSSLVFKGVTYTGDATTNKKEAEKLAARAVILSILDSESGNVMSEIIENKFKIYAALNKVKDSINVHNGTTHVGGQTGYGDYIPLNESNEVEVVAGTNNMPTPCAISQPCLGQPATIPATPLPLSVIQPPNPVASTAAITPPVTSVPSVLEQNLSGGSTAGKKRNRKNKKNAQKKQRVDAQLSTGVLPLSHVVAR